MTSYYKKNKPNLTIISPFGNTIVPDTSSTNGKSPLKPGTPLNMSSVNSLKRSASAATKLVEYEDDGDFMFDPKSQKENALLEDIQMKKRKLDENGNHVKIIPSST